MKNISKTLVLVLVAIIALSCVSCSKATPASTPAPTDNETVENDIKTDETVKDIGWEIHGCALYTPEGERFILKERERAYNIVAYNDTECIILSCYNELILFNGEKEFSYFNDGKPIKNWEINSIGFFHWNGDNISYTYGVEFFEA